MKICQWLPKEGVQADGWDHYFLLGNQEHRSYRIKNDKSYEYDIEDNNKFILEF